MGIISNASKNIIDMFGVTAEKAKGASINTMMPYFMRDEHDEIMTKWSQSGTWRTIGKLKEIFCVHKRQYCFSALIYLKIYIKDGFLHFITNIFKINEKDYLVRNPSGTIEGLGVKFLSILGEEAKNIPLHLLIENPTNLPVKE